MKNKIHLQLVFVLVVICTFFISNGMAQEKTKKQLRTELKIKKEKQTQSLIDLKEFVFVATMVIPQGFRTINLTDNYTVEYHQDSIKSHLPFFGRAFGGVGYGGDNGLKFKGKSEKYTVEKIKKSHVIKVQVKGEQDYFSLLLSVYSNGSAYLTLNSNNRSAISYNGTIIAYKK